MTVLLPGLISHQGTGSAFAGGRELHALEYRYFVRELVDIAEEEDLNGRIRGNILDTQRAINFLMRSRVLSSDQLSAHQTLISLRRVELLVILHVRAKSRKDLQHDLCDRSYV